MAGKKGKGRGRGRGNISTAVSLLETPGSHDSPIETPIVSQQPRRAPPGFQQLGPLQTSTPCNVPNSSASKSSTQQVVPSANKQTLPENPPNSQVVPFVKSAFPSQRVGNLGYKIALQANFFAIDIPQGSVYHYDVEIYRIKNGKVLKHKAGDAPPKRNLNAEICRKLINQLFVTNGLFIGVMPAYDGNKNIITRNPLPIKDVKNFTVKLTEFEKEEAFSILIKPVNKDNYDCEISLEPLHEAMGGRSSFVPQQCVMALDIVLRHGPSLKYVPVGRSFFEYPSGNTEILGGGKEIWFGLHQSLRPGWKPLPNSTRYYLNINKSATAFLTAQPVLDFMMDVLNLKSRNPRDQAYPSFLKDYQIKLLKDKLRNVKIQVNHLKYKRKYRVTGVSRDRASNITFKLDDKDISIPEYFQKTYQKLRFPNYPCIVAGDKKKVFLPLEVCDIVEGQCYHGRLDPIEQSKMVKKTVLPARQRLEQCIGSARKVKDASLPMLKEFGMDINTEPIKFPGRVLQAPKVAYKTTTPAAVVKNGQWEMKGKQFVNGFTVESWIILSFCSVEVYDMKCFANKLMKTAKESGMEMREMQAPPVSYGEINQNSIPDLITELKQRYNLQLAIVVLTKNSHLYKTLKKVCETKLGLITQCLTDQNIMEHNNDRFFPRFLLNLCQKINAKLGGTNTSLSGEQKPKIFSRPCMIIGADVTHPAPTDKEKYSIAAVVGSMDSGPSKYTSVVQLQKEEGVVRAREETILNLKKMIKMLLDDFMKRTNGHHPETIIYYRDGVSEGQFQHVRDSELIQIREACGMVNPNYEPKITFIVVQKRHHTRFFPQNFQQEGVGKHSNIPAGTTVDTDITSPSHFNFYLCSHVAIQGTSRPGHYNVLYDDSDFDANTLQLLTFYLCHVYARCTKSISIPPPVMYADLAAYRAKLYIDQLIEQRNSSDSGSSHSSDSGILSEDIINAILLKEEIRQKMYFL